MLLVVPAARFKGAAAQAADACRAAGLPFTAFDAGALGDGDVIVDALLGTGLARGVDGDFRAAVEAVNAAGAPVLALDVPSGLDADTGWPNPVAVRAAATVTFLGLKQGLFLGAAPDHCGELEFAGLELPPELGAGVAAPMKRLVLDGARARVAAPATQRAQGLVREAVARRRRTRDARRDPPGGRGRAARRCRPRLRRDASRQRRERAGRST